MSVSWTDPAGKTHTVSKSTVFSVPQTTAAPIPPDDTAVAVIPAQITNDQVLLDAQTTSGQTLHMQLDTGVQTVTLTAADAATLGLSDPGGSADISVQGVTGSSKAYISTVTLVLGGVTFTGIEAVVDADFDGPSLLGYDVFAGQYDLLVSQKHNSVTVLK
ncbi:retropepsin-like aspartic protease [Alicyclobacillus fodiniaquatilis]|uniref:Retropepsin-like aspartic protease n=1 Tax=Alicyclobacillus fodiniaquatilis TaxID=1661150 RepID=A0ABW4JG48_9BACL